MYSRALHVFPLSRKKKRNLFFITHHFVNPRNAAPFVIPSSSFSRVSANENAFIHMYVKTYRVKPRRSRITKLDSSCGCIIKHHLRDNGQTPETIPDTANRRILSLRIATRLSCAMQIVNTSIERSRRKSNKKRVLSITVKVIGNV